MTNLPEDLVRFYEDGPTWPQTPEQQDAERAYRDAFLLSAREAAHWTSIDQGAIDRAWEERRRVRSLAEVLIPSSKYFGLAGLDSQQVVYKREHVVDASRTRGRVHGFEFVRQCWQALTPLYLLAQSQMPVGLGTQHHYAFTHPRADVMYRNHIDPWLGRGPCAVVNDIGIAEDYPAEDLEYAIIGIVLHELAHILDRPALYDERDCDDPDRLQFDAMVLTDVSQRAARSDLPLYFGHGPTFIRIVIHLAHRATLAGFEIKAAGIFASHRLGLSTIGAYDDALGDEPHRHLDWSFRALAAIAPPIEFTQQWAADMHRYQVRFPKPQESYT